MGTVIAVTSGKGGTGKTSITGGVGACLALLDGVQLREPVMDRLLTAIQHHLDHRAGGAYQVGAVLFSNQYGPLGQSEGAREVLAAWQ